jgi:2-dehydro-3-deoxyglucarate aldolase/4-hydroxy-2-oxoheptanedioate aldolase
VLANLMAVRSGSLGKTASFVRIRWNDMVLAKPVLDMGPDAIIFPYVRTVEEARAAVAACTYPPAGVRGYGPLRALGYGADTPLHYVTETFRTLMRFIQVEHIDAVNCLGEMAKVEGIDGFIVGPNDLSGSVGHIGEPLHPDMLPIYDKIGEVLRGSGRLFGVSVGYDVPTIRQWLARGVNLLFTGNDVGYVYDGAIGVKRGLDELIPTK